MTPIKPTCECERCEKAREEGKDFGRFPGCDHEPPCQTDFRCKLLSLQWQGPGAQHRRDKDSSLSRDLSAYREMRRQGLKPAHVFGSAQVQATAGSKFEVEHHMTMSPEVRKEFVPRIADAEARK